MYADVCAARKNGVRRIASPQVVFISTFPVLSLRVNPSNFFSILYGKRKTSQPYMKVSRNSHMPVADVVVKGKEDPRSENNCEYEVITEGSWYA